MRLCTARVNPESSFHAKDLPFASYGSLPPFCQDRFRTKLLTEVLRRQTHYQRPRMRQASAVWLFLRPKSCLDATAAFSRLLQPLRLANTTTLLQRAAALRNEKVCCRSSCRREVCDELLETKQEPHLMARQGIATASQPLRAREPTAAGARGR